jgi:serine/threonine-protein kinase PknG
MRRGPSVATDLYTVGRSLAVLSFDFTGFTTRYADRLPEPADVPLLAREESYHRLLRRATDPDPDRRFRSAAEMREQLLGVLREVLSAGDGVPRPAPSTEFTPEVRAFGTEAGIVDRARPLTGFDGAAVAAALPRPQVDTADPGAGFLATLSPTDPDELVQALDAAPAGSVEVALRVVRARIERGDLARATTDLDKLAADDPTDWRVDWYRGLVALVAGRSDDARSAFSAVYDALPGEPAPKLAAAAAAEWSGDLEVAARLYERVWRADRGYVSAAFGLARIRLHDGGRAAAVTVLDEVPDSSSYHGAAQVAAVRARLTGSPATLAEVDLLDASTRLERLPIEPGQKARLTVEALETALAWVAAGPAAGPVRMLGHELTERGLRLGLERAYRLLAKAADDPYTRTLMVDRANACRPRTLT